MNTKSRHLFAYSPPRGWVGLVLIGFSLHTFAADAISSKSIEPTTEEFFVSPGPTRLRVEIQSPPSGRLAARPLLLLNFSMDRKSSLHGGRYGIPANVFLDHGHRVASFDLPAHGERIDRHGSGIDGLRALFLAGEDPFAKFVADGRAVIDECIRRGWAESGRVVVCGVSRAGYCAVRLGASDARIAAIAALAPVTDWRELREFAVAKDDPKVAALALDHFISSLVGRRLFVAIGNSDTRVGTAACLRFVYALCDAERVAGATASYVRFELVDDSPGHTLALPWRQQGIQFLLNDSGTAEKSGLP